MKKIAFLFLLGSIFIVKQVTAQSMNQIATDTIPGIVLGNFKDDYDISYTVTNSLFTQHPGIQYHIIKWNTKEQYFIAQNDTNNPGEKGLYTRVDYMMFQNMEPFKWGFCLTVYKAATADAAETAAAADRGNPRKGCNGYPFSRMKKLTN